MFDRTPDLEDPEVPLNALRGVVHTERDADSGDESLDAAARPSGRSPHAPSATGSAISPTPEGTRCPPLSCGVWIAGSACRSRAPISRSTPRRNRPCRCVHLSRRTPSNRASSPKPVFDMLVSFVMRSLDRSPMASPISSISPSTMRNPRPASPPAFRNCVAPLRNPPIAALAAAPPAAVDAPPPPVGVGRGPASGAPTAAAPCATDAAFDDRASQS